VEPNECDLSAAKRKAVLPPAKQQGLKGNDPVGFGTVKKVQGRMFHQSWVKQFQNGERK